MPDLKIAFTWMANTQIIQIHADKKSKIRKYQFDMQSTYERLFWL